MDQGVPIGANSVNGGTGTSITYSAVTGVAGDGASWFAGCGGNRTAAANSAPSGMTDEAHTTRLVFSDTNATATNWSSAAVTGNTSTGWRSSVVELIAVNNPPAPSQFVQTNAYQSNENFEPGNDFKFVLPQPAQSGNSIILDLLRGVEANRTVSVTDDKGNTYTKLVGELADGGGTFQSSIWGSCGVTGGAQTITVSFGPDTSYTVTNVSVANPTHITTSAANDFVTGEVVFITGTSTTPPIFGVGTSAAGSNGPITVIDSTHFTIPVNVTAVTTGTGHVQVGLYDVRGSVTEYTGLTSPCTTDGTASQNDTGPTITPGLITTATSGDLIHFFAEDVSWGVGMEGNSNTGYRASQNFHILTADSRIGFLSAVEVQAAAGGITPTVYLNNNYADNFSTLGVALKTNPAQGSQATQTPRILKQLHSRVNGGTVTNDTFFSGAGNAIVWSTAYPPDDCIVSAIADSTNGSWTLDQGPDSSPPGHAEAQGAHIFNATPNTAARVSITTGTCPGSNVQFIFYDIVGAATSPLDTKAFTSNGVGIVGPGNVADSPIYTPTVATNVLVISATGVNTGPPTSVSLPSGAIMDSLVYAGETDLTPADSGDFYGHYLSSSTTAQHWTFFDAAPGGTSGWFSWAIGVKAAAGSTTRTLTLLGVGS